QEVNKKCMLLSCKGYLNKDMECSYCSTIFCKLCENEKKKDHVCKVEDIESLKYVNSINKCPHCLTPIEKSQGCNTMKCTKCHEAFIYNHEDNIGIKGGGGNNHNANIMKGNNDFYNIYKNEINL